MQFFMKAAAPLLLLSSLPSVFTYAVDSIKPEPGKPEPGKTCCRYPGWPTTVLNFEYPVLNPDYTTYHGLSWKGWTGYNLYWGNPTGWAGIPSNFSTMHVNTGPEEYKVEVGPGTEKFKDVHSLWFNYNETTSTKPSDQYAKIIFLGYNRGWFVGQQTAWVSTWNDRVWQHICFNWTSKPGGSRPIDRLYIVLPDCKERGCDAKSLEIDDMWVTPVEEKK